MSDTALARKFLGDAPHTQQGRLILAPTDAAALPALCDKLANESGLPLKSIAAADERHLEGGFCLYYLFGVPGENLFIVPTLRVKSDFPSITPRVHQASIYERKIKTFFGLHPIGHPDPQPILLHENWPDDRFPLRKDFAWNNRPPEANGTPYVFEEVHGEGVYEIPVGPVHAGIIEPGHFRFHVAGEHILLLQAKLGYKHRGVEKLFETLPLADTLRLAERVSGDSGFSHSLAFAQAIEALAGLKVSRRDACLRVIFAELERITNHFGDIGFILQDTGFAFGGSHGARLREMVMQWHERLCGNRYLRGVNAFGGVSKDIDPTTEHDLKKFLQLLRKDVKEVISIAKNSDSVMNRLLNTGRLDAQLAADHGVVGVPARALGMAMDARKDFPYAAYADFDFAIAGEATGDVYARFSVRVEEALASIGLLLDALTKLKELGSKTKELPAVKLPAKAQAVGIVEGWRGDIVYFVSTDDKGNLNRVDVRDPSFPNWTAVGSAGPGNIVPDFPLINKSFNLSYSGNDL